MLLIHNSLDQITVYYIYASYWLCNVVLFIREPCAPESWHVFCCYNTSSFQIQFKMM